MVDLKSIGFMGGGMMCEALVGGLLDKKPELKIIISEPFAPRREYIAKTFPTVQLTSPQTALKDMRSVDAIILAVKPNTADVVLTDVGRRPPSLGQREPVFISIMAGVTLSTMEHRAGQSTHFVRVMPNTPSLIGWGCAALVANPACSQEDVLLTKEIFSAVCGPCVEELASETLMDPITGLSGSGPAYVYMMIEAMADAGVREGLPRELAMRFAAQTVAGAGLMVVQTGKHPAVLRNSVESPGGTTIAGTTTLDTMGFRRAVLATVGNAAARSRALGEAAVKATPKL